jgi:hypothetical protein
MGSQESGLAVSRVNKDGYMLRYFTRWVTEHDSKKGLRQIAWQVCDSRKFDKIDLVTFPMSEKAQAEGMCKLLNSIEEEGTNKC